MQTPCKRIYIQAYNITQTSSILLKPSHVLVRSHVISMVASKHIHFMHISCNQNSQLTIQSGSRIQQG